MKQIFRHLGVLCALILTLSAAVAYAQLPFEVPDIFGPTTPVIQPPTAIKPFAPQPLLTAPQPAMKPASTPGMAPGPGISGQFSGIVVDGRGRPLAGAEIRLECGLRTYSSANGEFAINNVPSGLQRVNISKPGYKTGKGRVDFNGSPRTMKVSLSSLSSPSAPSKSSSQYDTAAPQYGNFEVSGKAMHVGPRDRRVWVYQIEVNEIGGSGKSWKDTWWDDVGQSSYNLLCDGATIGQRYRIKITWKNHSRFRQWEKSNNWDVEFTRSGQTFTYDHPMN